MSHISRPYRFFGCGPGFLPERAREIGAEHGATLVNYQEPRCICDQFHAPDTCPHNRRHYFQSNEHGSYLENTQIERAVMEALERENLKPIDPEED